MAAMLSSCREGTTRVAKIEEIGHGRRGSDGGEVVALGRVRVWRGQPRHSRRIQEQSQHSKVGPFACESDEKKQEAGKTNWTGLMQGIIPANSTSSKELRHAKARRAGSIGRLRQDGKGELKAHDHDGFNSPMAVIDPRTLPRLRRIRQRPPPLTPRARCLSLVPSAGPGARQSGRCIQ